MSIPTSTPVTSYPAVPAPPIPAPARRGRNGGEPSLGELLALGIMAPDA